MKTMIVLASLLVTTAAVAAQEGYTVPAPRPQYPAPGSTVSHNYTCTTPQKNGYAIVGVRYALQISTAALAPQYNIVGATLLQAAVVPNPTWDMFPLKQTVQDENTAQFAGNDAIVTIEKSNFDATVEFASGTTMTCTMNK